MAEFEQLNENFLRWLRENGSTISPKIAIKDYSYEGAGRGIVAIEDVEENEVLFTIPRPIILSTETSFCKDLAPIKKALHDLQGWSPLILCMMYEIPRETSFWKPYFDILPRRFDTPMFWAEGELSQLQGTSINHKIGKDDAEKEFNTHILPIIQSNPDLFPTTLYTDPLSLFHICGSLIMAYSFSDETSKEDPKDDSDEDSDTEEVPSSILMIPLADTLNHRNGYNNARLFHAPDSVSMRSIKAIPRGSQIYNTYGELPNGELLRKYGFVEGADGYDVCEIGGEIVVDICCTDDEKKKEMRVDYLLDDGILADAFVLDDTDEIPPDLIMCVRTLSMPWDEFQHLSESHEVPKHKLNVQARDKLIQVLTRRMEDFQTSIEEDQNILAAEDISPNIQRAVMVRLGEKRVLNNVLDHLRSLDLEKRKAEEPGRRGTGKKIKI